MNTREVGKTGEDVAAKYMAKQGYIILQRNFVAPHGEVDIIAKEGNVVVFAEVKSRNSNAFGLPREAVTPYKQRTIALCAKYWLAQKKLYGVPVRFDVVEVFGKQVTVWKDAFRM